MGNVGTKVGAIVGGVIALVTGAGSINDLIPLVYISSILLLGVSLFALGGAGMAGFGPLGNR